MIVDTIKHRMQKIWRKKRMSAFLERIEPKDNWKVLDLGGLPEMWEILDLDLEITLLNLPGEFIGQNNHIKHNYKFIEADAAGELPFEDHYFDLVFSNSVIEHLGSSEQEEKFAHSVHRLAPRYWVQTPSIWFPIEAHCNMPFWWFYPQSFQNLWIERWKQKGYVFKWQQMLTTKVITLPRLKRLFPHGQVYTEYVAGFSKSYSIYYKI